MTNLIDSSSDDQHFSGPEPAATPAYTPEDTAAPQEPDTFDRAYVEELRREAAGYRTQLREMESVFDGYTPEERDALGQYLQISRLAEQGDPEAIAVLEELFGGEDEDYGDEFGYEKQGLSEDDLREIARQEAYDLFSQEQAVIAEQQAVYDIQQRAEQMGYEQGSDDYILLLKYANELDPSENPDLLAAADQQVKAYRQQIINAYIAEKQGSGGPLTPTMPGSAPNLAQPPRTLAEAREALHQRLMRDFG